MLVQFSVQNYRSFKDEATLSTLAEDAPDTVQGQSFKVGGLELLRCAVIYGANASGKSNLVSAMAFTKRFVLDSSRETQSTDYIHLQAFQLSPETERAPSEFEVVFIHGGTRFRYGFAATRSRVHREWLWYTPRKRSPRRNDKVLLLFPELERSSRSGEPEELQEVELFSREGAEIDLDRRFREARGLEQRTRPNALFLSVAAQLNVGIAVRILNWFESWRIVPSMSTDEFFDEVMPFTVGKMKDLSFRAEMVELLKAADLSIEDIITASEEMISTFGDLPVAASEEDRQRRARHAEYLQRSVELYTRHPTFDAAGNRVGHAEFRMKDESDGTQKFLALSAHFLDTVKRSGVLVIDELDARLHPLLTRAIIRFFHSQRDCSPAQLIFTTHDATLLQRDLFRPDQVWFAEKDSRGATSLFSLVEYELSGSSVFQRDYMQGKYGAIPAIGEELTSYGVSGEEPKSE